MPSNQKTDADVAAEVTRINRAQAAAEIREARRRIANVRQLYPSAAPGARRLLDDEIAFQRRLIARCLANARAFSAAPIVPPEEGADWLLRQMEADGTLDRMVAQFRDDMSRQDRLTRLSTAMQTAPAGRQSH